MNEILPFFLILFSGVLFSYLSKKLRAPWVVGLIVAGMVIGPYGLNVIEIESTMKFISQIGLIFLMFMAGLETKTSSFKEFQGKLFGLAFINGAIPFIVGFLIGYLFGYDLVASLLIGIIFISSSIAMVIPSLSSNGLLKTRLGQSVVMTSVIQDIASLIFLSIILQNLNPVTNLPLSVFYPLVFTILFILKFTLPRLIRLINFLTDQKDADLFGQDFRIIFIFLLGTVLIFEILGLHSIIAAFFTGLILSETIQSKILINKIHTISYGVFIPTFFILVGAQANIKIFTELNINVILLPFVIILGSVISKFVSGWWAAKLVGFDSNQSLLFAISSIPQLSTTLAVVTTAFSFGLIDINLSTAMIMLSIITILISPSLMNIFADKIKESISE